MSSRNVRLRFLLIIVLGLTLTQYQDHQLPQQALMPQ